MLGTLNAALVVRQVRLAPGEITATVHGHHELRDRLPVLSRIEVHHRLIIPPGSREAMQRALDRPQAECPTAATLRGAVEVRWTADVEEPPGS
jgi:uncharacterized OsmC-like protein